MAWIDTRSVKRGTTYRINVSFGIDEKGKPITRRLNWKPDEGMTQKQIDKALSRIAADFERGIEQGYQLDEKHTFREYADYVMELKARTGVRPRTLDRYHELLVRINAAIGHLKLSQSRPHPFIQSYNNRGYDGLSPTPPPPPAPFN